MNNQLLASMLKEEITFEEILERYAEAAMRGGSASDFLKKSFVSFLGSSKICLNDFGSLDSHNRIIFFQMLNIRSTRGWTQEGLGRLLRIIESKSKLTIKSPAVLQARSVGKSAKPPHFV